MRPVLSWLEPFALDLWQRELQSWLPEREAVITHKQLLCGGLYQVLALTIASGATRQSDSEFGKLCP